MGTPHPLMHRISQTHLSFLTGLNRRRTDDGARRSAALDQLNLRLAQNLQWLATRIVQFESSLDWRLEFNIAIVNSSAVNCQFGRATCRLGRGCRVDAG